MNNIPLNLYGLFTLLSPFTINSTINYKVTALTLLTTLVENGINVFSTYYSPNGLTNLQFQTDLSNGVSLVTLESNDGPTVYVLSNYVNTLPSSISVPYSRLVVSIDLGELPDSINLDLLQSNLTSVTTSMIGVNAVTKLHVIPSITNYSQSQSTIMEAIRNLNITNSQSFYTGMINAINNLTKASTRLNMLQSALIAAKARITALGG